MVGRGPELGSFSMEEHHGLLLVHLSTKFLSSLEKKKVGGAILGNGSWAQRFLGPALVWRAGGRAQFCT